jgi:transcriptional regulator with XRE-family HTH domain
MIPQTLEILSRQCGKSQADLARIAGVSRQAVSKWFKAKPGSEVDVLSSHLRKLADGLDVSADILLRPLPVLGDPEATLQYEAALLWDRIYPDLADFSAALAWGELPALARLVQVYGLFRASKVAGRRVWDRFHDYKRLIRPVRREQLECIWKLRHRLNSN